SLARASGLTPPRPCWPRAGRGCAARCASRHLQSHYRDRGRKASGLRCRGNRSALSVKRFSIAVGRARSPASLETISLRSQALGLFVKGLNFVVELLHRRTVSRII